jgi:hypothetical protein
MLHPAPERGRGRFFHKPSGSHHIHPRQAGTIPSLGFNPAPVTAPYPNHLGRRGQGERREIVQPCFIHHDSTQPRLVG